MESDLTVDQVSMTTLGSIPRCPTIVLRGGEFQLYCQRTNRFYYFVTCNHCDLFNERARDIFEAKEGANKLLRVL